MNQQMRDLLLAEGTKQLAVCLGWIADCGSDAIIATNSGGRARYCVLVLDNEQIHVEKLDWRFCPV